MALEVATYISQLVNTNPPGADDRSTADDHLRLIKVVLQSQFPNFNAVSVTATPTQINGLSSLAASKVMQVSSLGVPQSSGVSNTALSYIGTLTSNAQTQINGKEAVGVAAALVDDLSGVTNASAARSNLGLGGLAILNSPLALGSGGTGATSASAARTSLGLGALAVLNSPVQIADGGTGQTTVVGAQSALGLGALALLNSVGTSQINVDSVTQAKVADNAVGQTQLKTSTALSLSGTISSGSTVYIILNSHSFFPMIYTAGGVPSLVGHNVSGASADNPRFGLKNVIGASRAYEVECRSVTI